MEIGIDSFAASFSDGKIIKESSEDAIANVLERIELADKVGLDVFGIGEHHRKDMLTPQPRLFLRLRLPAQKEYVLQAQLQCLARPIL